ncbi:BTB/POZ domain-containing protein KCTD9-like [Liolophura sinensis]|uniref:BTB/POZ domain-containing protein KCTD9-like n=1 Tax=Liolophura sinensis TaxID=3198878 RepID=UPI0031593081
MARGSQSFRNGLKKNGKVVPVTQNIEDVLGEASRKLNIPVTCLYTADGGEIDDPELIRDGEILYASIGEEFFGRLSSSHISCKVVHPVQPSYLDLGEDLDSAYNSVTSADIVLPTGKTDWVTLNVGGKVFKTTRRTLTSDAPESMLARMFTNECDVAWSSSVDENGAYLIDRSPEYFEPILNYLRHGQLVLNKGINPQGVLEEAKFYGISSLIDELEETIEKDVLPNDDTAINRREMVLKLLAVPTNSELRCQGINFCGINLSKLDLRCINFKYAVLRNADLSGSNLSHCNFERADMSRAVLDGANLLGVKMLCVNLEAASLKGCNFEDPAGIRANMEGAQMKNVNLEGSHMAGVNLRVATLKNGNLQNCDLRGAVLAGADLENCDLSGCDLQEANLRGANLKGAAFELMLNPLHMSQAVR